ncbi:MAG TPA: alpha/beta hydrolase [Caulobacteraceae bacterium]|jgi:pimeloyl-ACP methyl ester carboxylesterase
MARTVRLSLAFAATLVGGALGYRSWRQRRAAAAQAIRSPNGIDEARFVEIGGIQQWVSIRGEDRANPVLVVAHGGPGNAFLPFTYEVLRPWEAHFTVVQWDQRGAGLTYSRGSPKGQGELSLERIVEDGFEVVSHALGRTGQAKAILLGVSWGSVVGVAMARQRPELFHAFVGAGQMIDWDRNEAVGYAGLMQRVRAAADRRSEQALIEIGPPPYAGLKQVAIERSILMSRHPPAGEKGLMRRLMVTALFAPGFSLKQLYESLTAGQFSIRALWGELISYRDPKPYAPFEIPVFFIQGAEDIQTPTSLVEEYFAEIDAPTKQLILLPGGGHMAIVAESAAFLEALITYVLPAASKPARRRRRPASA